MKVTEAVRDAGHIALATVHEMDMLLTWNCRHIANAFIQAKLRKLAATAGFTLPVIRRVAQADASTGGLGHDRADFRNDSAGFSEVAQGTGRSGMSNGVRRD